LLIKYNLYRQGKRSEKNGRKCQKNADAYCYFFFKFIKSGEFKNSIKIKYKIKKADPNKSDQPIVIPIAIGSKW